MTLFVMEKEASETTSRLFLQCPFSSTLVKHMIATFDAKGYPESIRSLWSTWRKKRIRKKVSLELLGDDLLLEHMHRRNNKIFLNYENSLCGVIESLL